DRGVDRAEARILWVGEAGHRALSLGIAAREQPPERLRYTRDLRLADVREERQRERPAADVLADGKLPLAPAEALAVEAHEVDRREVGLRLDALFRQRRHQPVTIGARRDLDHVYEP